MRQGPDYSQWIDKISGRACLFLPMELEDEWQDFRVVNWHVNPDGTVLLTPEKGDWK